MIFRIYFKDNKRHADVEGDTLAFYSSTRLVGIDLNGKCVALINMDEIIAVKALLEAR